MKKNDIVELEIIDIGNNGEGIAKKDNLTIFIPFALVGEIIETLILKVNKHIAFGKINKIIKASKMRIEPICPYFTKCGGCDIQHIKYEEQLKIKNEIVKTALHKYAEIECDILPCFASEMQYGYRNKMQYPCTVNGIGMFAKNSHRVVSITSCPLSMPLCDMAYQMFKEFCSETNQSLYDEEKHYGLIRNVLFREIDNKVAICIVINGDKIDKIDVLIKKLKEKFNDNFSLFLNINKKKINTILSNETHCIYGEKELQCEDFGIKYFISPNSFLQINRDIQNKIYANVLDFIEKDDIVINAYSGAGLLTAIIAKKAKYAYGIEIIKQATDNANLLMQHNKVSNVKNITADCAIELPKLISKFENKESTVLVLDPPRKGCEENILKAINSSLPQKIAYISCNPATLARDLFTLKDNYSIHLIQPYDMFPQTRHIETLVLLKRK